MNHLDCFSTKEKREGKNREKKIPFPHKLPFHVNAEIKKNYWPSNAREREREREKDFQEVERESGFLAESTRINSCQIFFRGKNFKFKISSSFRA
jgi:hypothetical protein